MGRKNNDSFDDLQRKKKYKLQNYDERMRELNNPAKSAHEKQKRRKKKKQYRSARRFGRFLVVVQALLSILFVGVMLALNILPTKYMIGLVLVLVGLLGIVHQSQKRAKKRGILGKILSIIVISILGIGVYYVGVINGAFDKLIGGTHKIDTMVVAVRADDDAESIEDAKNYLFGVQYQLGEDDVEDTIDAINEEVGTTIDLAEYDDVQAQAEALFNNEVEAIIYNDGYTDMLDEEIENFEENIKIIYTHEIKKELENSETAKIDVTDSTFSVYLSGIDVYGDISQSSRSDVNIIATVNPETHQVLLITTPRDSYVTIPGVSDGQKDKLTHAGIYGVDASIAALENLYETTIPFYARVNFTSIIDIVDELGGIDVYSEYAFTTLDGVQVKEGMNHFDGKEALSFSRERKNVPDGDNQRGKNQQAVIVAMIKKMISPQILLKATGIINSVSDNVETNMSQAQMQELIKMQLNEGGSWSIYSVAAEGIGTTAYTYSMPSTKLYVTELMESSIEEIKDLMDCVKSGEMLDGSEVAE